MTELIEMSNVMCKCKKIFDCVWWILNYCWFLLTN